MQNRAAKFSHHRNDSHWETLAQRREIAPTCALLKAYAGEWTWKGIGHRLQRPCYPSRVDGGRKIRRRNQRTDIGNYFFVNKAIELWTLSQVTLGKGLG
jgi:hypothetical protein